jgi:hypothetical protein
MRRDREAASTKQDVMPGLDPGIHPSSQERFSKVLDGRVKPGNDEVN